MDTVTSEPNRPLFEKVREELRRKCLASANGGALPTLRRLSEDFGVNHLTIARALRDLQSDGLVEIVPRKGIFIVPTLKAAPALQVVTMTSSVKHLAETPSRIFSGMHQESAGRYVISGSTLVAPAPVATSDFIAALKERQTVGVAVLGVGFCEHPELLQEANFLQELTRQIPTLLVGEDHPYLPLQSISFEARPLLRAFLDEQYAQGARRFGYLGVEIDRPHFRERFETFRQFYLDYGLRWNSEYAPRQIEPEVAMAAELLSVSPCPEVVVAVTLSRAYSLVLEAQRRGLKPGEDIHIVCVASSRENALSILPYATVIFFDEEELGRQVLRRLEALMRHSSDERESMPSVRMPARLLSALPAEATGGAATATDEPRMDYLAVEAPALRQGAKQYA